MDKIKAALTANPYTTLIALGAVVALLIWSKQITAVQAANLILTALLGAGAADAKKGSAQ